MAANDSQPAVGEKRKAGMTSTKDNEDEPQKQAKLSDSPSQNKPHNENDDKTSENGAIKEQANNADRLPTTLLEKGIIYFFTRARIGIKEPEEVSDLQRTFIVLRPLARDANLKSQGTIPDGPVSRLLALPKKTLPKSHRDRFMAFVDKAPVSIKQLKEESFFKGNEYDTKTSGTRRQEPIMPVAEGVYALTQAQRSSHLTYMVTVPKELGEVQRDLGLRREGRFVISVKNPERPGPASARLPQKPGLPKEYVFPLGCRLFSW